MHPYAGGSNENGRLGDGSTKDSKKPVAVAGGGTWLAVSAGSGHTCGLKTDGALLCWGGFGEGKRVSLGVCMGNGKGGLKGLLLLHVNK